MTRRQTIDRIASALTPLYDHREARSIALRVVSDLTRLTLTQLTLTPDAECAIDQIDQIVAQLAAGRPVQYVVGHTEFCELEITVQEGVLIPRPETEELVAWITQTEARAGRMLDVGTGSGCIALGIKHKLPKIEAFATDLSDDALAIAARNAHRLSLEVTLRKSDALSNLAEIFPEPFDVIVSNPPYVPQSDLPQMHTNVRDHEPHGALFVPDHDPLRFYRAIARAGQQMLRPGGRLYFEIYHLFAEQMIEMLTTQGYTQIEIREDLVGKPRMVRCRMG